MTDKSKPAIERFWEIEEAARGRAKDARMFFDEMRRSTALVQLSAMRYRKQITDEETERFSAETREVVRRVLEIGGVSNWNRPSPRCAQLRADARSN